MYYALLLCLFVADEPRKAPQEMKPEKWKAVVGYGFGFYVLDEKGKKIVPTGANSYWVMRDANDLAKARNVKATIEYVEEYKGGYERTQAFGPAVLPAALPWK